LFFSVDAEPLAPELRWRIATVKEVIGKKYALAGKPISLYTHRVGRRTLPCLRCFPTLGWECPHCERARALKCWCPIVPLDLEQTPPPLRVLMGATTLHNSLKFIKVAETINVGRALTLKPTWIVTRSAQQDLDAIGLSLCANHVPERGDITRWLLHYWQWPKLTTAFGEKYRESIRVKSDQETRDAHKMLTMLDGDAA
jgi:hypothetical protein